MSVRKNAKETRSLRMQLRISRTESENIRRLAAIWGVGKSTAIRLAVKLAQGARRP